MKLSKEMKWVLAAAVLGLGLFLKPTTARADASCSYGTWSDGPWGDQTGWLCVDGGWSGVYFDDGNYIEMPSRWWDQDA